VWQIFLAHFADGGQDRQLSWLDQEIVPAQEPAVEAKLSREASVQALRQRVEEVLGKVADAVNEATPGRIINGSEEQVRDLFAKRRRQAFEQALQMRVDAAEAAFPPSEGAGDTKDHEE
jgi:hypothetical protein